MKKACAFCQLADTESSHQEPIWNTVLFQSPNFVALPTIGSLVEGWLLIATKRHYICMGALENSLAHELCDFKHLVLDALQNCYGDVATFEHGPSYEQQAVGCGVDHAHLHLVPSKRALKNDLATFYDTTLKWGKVTKTQNPSSCFHAGKAYLHIEQENDGEYILTDLSIKSQSFRRVVAEHVGQPDQYNWREHPYFHNATSTVQTLQEWKLRQSTSVRKMLG